MPRRCSSARPAEGRDQLVVFEVPLERLSFEEDHKAKTYKLQFSLLALVSDDQGHVVERFSDDYPFEGPLDKLAGLKKGNLIFKRPFSLKPGNYKVDFVAQDRGSGKTSVESQAMTVLPAGACALSSISVIRRIEDAGELRGRRSVPRRTEPRGAEPRPADLEGEQQGAVGLPRDLRAARHHDGAEDGAGVHAGRHADCARDPGAGGARQGRAHPVRRDDSDREREAWPVQRARGGAAGERRRGIRDARDAGSMKRHTALRSRRQVPGFRRGARLPQGASCA